YRSTSANDASKILQSLTFGVDRTGNAMKVHLLDYFRSFLLHSPPYTSTLLVVQEWDEPVLVMRVEDLSLFLQGGYRVRLGFQTWQSTSGTWVVAVPFCLEVHP